MPSYKNKSSGEQRTSRGQALARAADLRRVWEGKQETTLNGYPKSALGMKSDGSIGFKSRIKAGKAAYGNIAEYRWSPKR
tara:strand:+ start:320 stop:559 length:240 start_codon:yes stop_codon:yes gene_type:complete